MLHREGEEAEEEAEELHADLRRDGAGNRLLDPTGGDEGMEHGGVIRTLGT